ncbi:MAG: VWA domain-containing protein [Bacteroidota bacterium]
MGNYRQYIGWIFLTVAYLLPMFASAQPQVSARLDSTRILIGDQLKLSLSARYSPGTRMLAPDLSFLDSLTSIEVLKVSLPDSSSDGSQLLFQQELIITSFDSGAHFIPAIPFRYILNGRNGMATTNELLLEVATPQIDTIPLAPIKWIMEEPFNFEDIYGWLIGVFGLILVGFLIWWYIRYRNRPKEVVAKPAIVIPAHELALQKLEELKAARLWQQGEVKAYHSQLTYIFREYLENRFKLQALESTTDEIARQLSQIQLLDQETERQVRQMLQQADLVKFAKAKPPEEIHDQLFQLTESFVLQTRSRMAEETAQEQQTEQADGETAEEPTTTESEAEAPITEAPKDREEPIKEEKAPDAEATSNEDIPTDAEADDASEDSKMDPPTQLSSLWLMGLWSEDMSFVNPGFLFLLLLIPLAGAFYYFRYKKHYASLRMSSLRSLQGLTSWRGRLRSILPILRCLSFIALVIALARPQLSLKEEEITADGIDIMLVMDLSSSMLAQDFKPDRLEVSKKVAADFVDKRKFDRIGLAVFAGEAFTQCPLTTDHSILKEFLANLECGILEDGTAIGMGLATAVNRLKESEAKSKVVILLTDGDNNAGYVKPITAAEIASEFDVKVYTIGVGSRGKALAPVSRRSDGKYIFGLAAVQIDEALLKQIAEMTKGRYYRATSAQGLEEVYAEIDQLEKTEIEITAIKRNSEEFHAFAFWGLLFLLVELLLRYSLFRTLP